MLKTPHGGAMIAAMILAAAHPGLTAPVSRGAAAARVHDKPFLAGLNAWDGRPLGPAGVTAVGPDVMGASTTPPSWDGGVIAEGARSAADFHGASKLANVSQETGVDVLPLSQLSGSHAKPSSLFGVGNLVDRVRYGRLPEPASWALILIGFGMIGGALRGFVVANRSLARLQPEDGEEFGL